MPAIPPAIYPRLEETLLNCGVFETDATLKAIFVDARIHSWRDELKIANSSRERVRLNIDFLSDQYNRSGENVLILLLRVLSERQKVDNLCHSKLLELADELDAMFSPTKPQITAPAHSQPFSEKQSLLMPALKMARRSLSILEERAAAYTVATIPAHLKIELELKREEVAKLEARTINEA